LHTKIHKLVNKIINYLQTNKDQLSACLDKLNNFDKLTHHFILASRWSIIVQWNSWWNSIT